MRKEPIISLLLVFGTMPAGAQDVNTLNVGQDSSGQFQGNVGNIEDSDNVLKYDYYSGVFMVRSGSQYYSVKCGNSYGKKEYLFAEIANTSNAVIDSADYDRVTNEQLGWPQFYKPNEEQMAAVVREVFSKCTLGVDDTRNIDLCQCLSIVMSVDPDTEKVIDMKFTIHSDKPGVQKQNTAFSIPPLQTSSFGGTDKGEGNCKDTGCCQVSYIFTFILPRVFPGCQVLIDGR